MSREVAAMRLTIVAVYCAMTSTPLAAQVNDPAAQDYIRQAKRKMGLTSREDCGKPDADGSIIVCGRRGPDPNRLPLPDEREDVSGNHVRGDIRRATDGYAPAPTCRAEVGKVNSCGSGSVTRAAKAILNNLID